MRVAFYAAIAWCFLDCGSSKSSATYDVCDTPAADVKYGIENSGWPKDGGWEFIFDYTVPTGTYSNWRIQLTFNQKVESIAPYNAIVQGSYQDGHVWILEPEWWNVDIVNQMEVGSAMAFIYGNGPLYDAQAQIYNNGGSCINGGNPSATTSSPTTTTTDSNEITTSPGVTTPSTYPSQNCNGNSGDLPYKSDQVNIQYTAGYTSDNDKYDYNEILYKSILFYQAQRSGPFDNSNLIPWRGSSALTDGCTSGVDLRGGWYDAGDFVKFGFPMAYTATVLAWGMTDFKEGYVEALQWENALNMLKWATDYFLRAHTAPSELYFQVGDGFADHSYWGHPETMNMARPAYKIDTSHPGSEVAAETAAALAASYLVFKDIDQQYANTLKQHAIQLYDFAYNYRGNYHETVPDSRVDNFYKSWNGYADELMWGAMWLYKVTEDGSYIEKAEEFADSVGMNEFSWDSKGPGAMVLLSQYVSSYKGRVDSALQTVMSMPTTPGGLTYFSEWGTNRYAANYALIALATAKMDGVNSQTGNTYYNYAKTQINKMLGDGDNQRSYVVGFGSNPPQRPHHRSSSCRSWNNGEPWASSECNSQDQNNPGPNPQILYGALVGGPGQDGSYVDDRGDYVKNEVATDYNAGFQSAVAALKYFQTRI